MVMFFNIKSVREFLINNGYVFTLRKKRFRIGRDMAVYGNYYIQTKIGNINIEKLEQIASPNQLSSYINESGLKDIEKWFGLATKLSGQKLYLYKVTLIGSKSVCVCVEDARESI